MESKGWIIDRVWKQGFGRSGNSHEGVRSVTQALLEQLLGRQRWQTASQKLSSAPVFLFKKIIPSRLFHNMASSNRRGGTSNWSAVWWNCETGRNIQDGPFSGALPAWEEMKVTVKDKWTQAWRETDKFPVAASGVKIWTVLTCLVL